MSGPVELNDGTLPLSASLIVRNPSTPAAAATALLGEPTEIVESHWDVEANAQVPHIWIRSWPSGSGTSITGALVALDRFVVDHTAQLRDLLESGWNMDVRVSGETELFSLGFRPADLPGIIGLDLQVVVMVWLADDSTHLSEKQ